ncbi:MAG: DUF6324 family protein [Rubrimonas sp.]|uniref:DUF6324 family protein n=1 Tax=Rubrimonas sp. TaxID=2036015 RepID=UPI002FDDD3DF
MSINSESDAGASLQIGPTTLGMVRIYVEQDGAEIPMDFTPEEAEEIAEELRAAAAQARRGRPSGQGPASGARRGG